MIAAAAAFAGALVALFVYHAAVVRPAIARLSETLQVHDGLIGGTTHGASARLSDLQAGQQRHAEAIDAATARVGALEALAATDVSRIGFVRYNAMDDGGSELSYAMALLNRNGDGVVISSLYSRADTRTFGKTVEAFTPGVHASEEELQAIARARGAR
ncbi:MAG TPA: DUF4446 family protein [Candidatus Tumulicola sp.]